MENYEDIINSKVNEELDKIKFKFKELGYEWRDEYSFIFRQGALIGVVASGLATVKVSDNLNKLFASRDD